MAGMKYTYRLDIRVTPELANQMREIAAANDRVLSAECRRAFKAYIRRERPPEPQVAVVEH
jgi:predicted transcriptional regulator